MQAALIVLATMVALAVAAVFAAACVSVCIIVRELTRAIRVHLAYAAVEAGVCAGSTKHDGQDAIIEYGLVHALAAEPGAFKALDFDNDVLGRMALAKLANSKRATQE